MNGESCIITPLAKKDNKPSKLYKELLRITKKRELANLIYAISLQDNFISKFDTHSDFNNQGELKTDILMQALNVQKLIDSSTKIEEEALKLKAIDSDKHIVYINDIDSRLQEIINYNKNNEEFKASIKHNDQGYYIDVDITNAENFNNVNSYTFRANLFNNLMKLMRDKGFNTIISDYNKSKINSINVFNVINVIKNFKTSNNELSPYNVSILSEFFTDNPLYTRLKSVFGDDLNKAISQVSGYTVINSEDIVEIDDYTETQVQRFLDLMFNTLQNVSNGEIDYVIQYTRDTADNVTTYGDTEGLDIKKELKNLYTLYHIDQKNLNLLNSRVKKLSEAAMKTLQMRTALLNQEEMKGDKTNERQKKHLLKIQRDISKGYYADSIISMLKDTVSLLNQEQATLNLLERRISSNPDSINNIVQLSTILNRHLTTTNTLKDWVDELINREDIEFDDALNSVTAMKDIKEAAKQVRDILDSLYVKAREKQFDTVRTFLMQYWGESKMMSDGTVITIDDIMSKATQDVSMLDRFLYSVGDTSDVMMNLIAQAIKEVHNKRDERLSSELYDIRTATEELYKTNSNTKFMFELDENGYPSKIISDYDYNKYDKELEQYKKSLIDNKIPKNEWDYNISEWVYNHTTEETLTFNDISIKLHVPVYKKAVSVKDRLTDSQYKYYQTMMSKKADTLNRINTQNNDSLFNIIEISNDLTSEIAETGGSPKKLIKVIKDRFVDTFTKREDDTEYGSVLEGNDIMSVPTDAKQEQINQLPLFYTHKLQDRSRVSTDFSRSMMAFMATSINYQEISNILDALLLTKDYMMQRQVNQTIGDKLLAGQNKLGKETYFNVVTKRGEASRLAGLAEDYFERVVYNKRRKGTQVWGVQIDKLVDTLTSYTSITGLSVNLLGSEVNTLVGKVQLLIESGMGLGGQFFGMKDLAFADVEYFHMLPELLVEINSNNKTSKLGLLMEKFDVLDDFYEKAKETGFYNNPLSKIIGNSNMFMLYGLGEHLIHAQTMIAILHNIKVVDGQGNIKSLLDAFEVTKTDKNGKLTVKEGYRFYDSNTKEYSEITPEAIFKIKKRIKYCNNSMHGAFGTDDKGMIHRYAFGRLVMNFRQWMPAHYSRRFRANHYNADLEDWVEGYYITTGKFLKDCIVDIYQHRFELGARWKQLNATQRYNINRAITELSILAMISASLLLLGDYKDARNNWAKRRLIYVLKRLQVDVRASVPSLGMLDNMTTILNSPIPSMNTIQDLRDLLKVTDLAETIQSGKYKGENRYVRNLEKRIPFYSQIMQQAAIGDDDALFQIFN